LTGPGEAAILHSMQADPWWQNAVVYQIYPRSFNDSNGDGVGDLPGITARLDYLAGAKDSLGVDAIWISPFYPSPMKDAGYDVSDYTDVDPVFGTLDDFKTLLSEAHARGIRIIIDLVLNHTSDEHPWFIEARSDRSSPKHDWYIWSEQKRPNNWLAGFELQSAWWHNPATDDYYLGTFTRHQPEVNWRNPEVRAAMYDVMRFWLDLGVDGFRLDVVNWYIKDEKLRSNPLSLRLVPDIFQRHVYDRNRPETHEICREMRLLADDYGDRVLVGEIYSSDTAEAAQYHGPNNDELHMAFNFNFLFQPWSARRFFNAASRWYAALPHGAWPNFNLSNHDQVRHISRYAAGTATEARARVAAALLLTLRGTPFLYYGEEIGMRNQRIPRRLAQDPLAKSSFGLAGRDGERTPMQWTDGPGAGFTSGTPWLPIGEDAETRNAEAVRADPDSLFHFYRRLIELRKSMPALLSGEISFLSPGERGVLAYRRSTAEQTCMVLLNFRGRPRTADLGAVAGAPEARVVFGTRRWPGEVVSAVDFDLSPYEVLILAPVV
jgi:alpha-glucosidase